MTEPTQNPNFKPLLEWATDFGSKHSPVPMDGEYYDMPGKVVYNTSKHPLSGKGRLEVNLTTPEARGAFSWLVELTIDDLENDVYKHILLQTDGTIVETYGKQVTPVDESGAKKILDDVHRLSAA